MEISMNQIDFFKGLSQHIKNEIIFNMRRRELEMGSLLYQLDTNSVEMYLLQSGKVEVTHFI